MGGLWNYLTGSAGPSGFGSKSTAEDVTGGMDLSSKTIIISGATSGIGKEVARVLAKRGAHVIMAIRNMETGEKVKSAITEESPKARVDVMKLDLQSLASVRQFSEEFKSRKLPLNVLINNAGYMSGKFELSADGLEKVFATNQIGTFLLTKLLLNSLKSTAKETGEEGRVVNVASEAHRYAYKGGVVFDKLNDPSRYQSNMAYGQSKLANILHAKELAKRLKEEGANVTANALHPGVISTNFGKGQSFIFSEAALSLVKFALKTVPQGAATTCYLATNPQVKGVSGQYFKDCNVYPSVSAYANDPELAAKLWDFSEEFVSTH
jgi:WW domain-containing oxidoreductase